MSGRRKVPLPKFKPVTRPIAQPLASSSQASSHLRASASPLPTAPSSSQLDSNVNFSTTHNTRTFNNATSRHIHITVPTRKRPSYQVAHQDTPVEPASRRLDTHPSGTNSNCGPSETYDHCEHPHGDAPPEKRAKTRHRRKRVYLQPFFFLAFARMICSFIHPFRLICSKNGRTVVIFSWTRSFDGEGGVAHHYLQYVRVAVPTREDFDVASVWGWNSTVHRVSVRCTVTHRYTGSRYIFFWWLLWPNVVRN